MKEFADHFWGEKNNGFDVLYHNMKHGYISSKELADFIRDRTFSPVWQILKNSSERLSGLHMGLTHKFQEIVKDIQKYNEEQHKKHRSMKDQESGTLEVVQSMQQTTQLVQKSKETYTARCLEYEKLKRDAGTSPKDLEKAVSTGLRGYERPISYDDGANCTVSAFELKVDAGYASKS
ncbi:PREDICTED: F-BAR domain only protein 2-like [Priapulus caudatus]|uniref:F-BAR domain only protein 2-like n=1 Tax=Priapulus caudatus TaxID=37621 RepID=A0ABM1DR05_PRICU|nr:PREDICTED: F-BAR domain only protein 2-like [Priapulus caudatus]